jgi:hypothetical protein
MAPNIDRKFNASVPLALCHKRSRRTQRQLTLRQFAFTPVALTKSAFTLSSFLTCASSSAVRSGRITRKSHRLYLALHERPDALDGRARFRKDPRPDLPGVRHPPPYFELDLTSGGAHPLRHAY